MQYIDEEGLINYLYKMIKVTNTWLYSSTEELPPTFVADVLIDFRPHALSVIGWIVSTFGMLRRVEISWDRIGAKAWLNACYDINTSLFKSHPWEDPSIMGTLSALQIIAHRHDFTTKELILNIRSKIRDYLANVVSKWISKESEIYNADQKAFAADVRTLYAALACVTLCDAITGEGKAVRDEKFELSLKSLRSRLERSENQHSGGFGNVAEDSEAHGGYTFCGVSSLALIDKLEIGESIELSQKTVEFIKRLTKGGSFKGRPNKQTDICYAFWLCATWVNSGRSIDNLADRESIVSGLMRHYTLHSGFSRRCNVENVGDPFHTNFGLAALSLVNAHSHDTNIAEPPRCWISRVDTFLAVNSRLIGMEHLKKSPRNKNGSILLE